MKRTTNPRSLHVSITGEVAAQLRALDVVSPVGAREIVLRGTRAEIERMVRKNPKLADLIASMAEAMGAESAEDAS